MFFIAISHDKIHELYKKMGVNGSLSQLNIYKIIKLKLNI